MTNGEWGIFSDEGCVESDFWSREEAEEAIKSRYAEDDDLHAEELQIEEEYDEDYDPEEEDEDTSDDNYMRPTPY